MYVALLHGVRDVPCSTACSWPSLLSCIHV